MPCVEDFKKALMTAAVLSGVGLAVWLTGCANHKLAGEKTASTPATAGPAKPVASADALGTNTKASGRPGAALPAPATSRNWKEVRLQAARRLVAANPDITYMGRPPDLLRAIPVLTIELHGDGSIRRIDVMRYPSQDRETVQIAMNALRRAAPFGDVSRLPKPWHFNETFLFNNQHKFKPMTLDQL
ncbi:MAG: hypothetical protein EOP38_21530 [Rubrivivax sp.]|nr:MAG: hypothetical protein EOP38_21530 [Rubrivivax sp.]